ncbi:MAG: peptidoglycan DD-metalloendopeptidase family protein [Deltaproteobacteria bacterium]|nr:peptidoglycan DD-metalloendopeptidase family protein [Deltaproteobacteria bacterium]
MNLLFVAVWSAHCALAQNGGAAPAVTVKQAVANLDVLRRELEAKQGAVADLAVQERSLLDSLGELDEGLARLDDDRRFAEERLSKLSIEVATLERARGLDDQELAALKARLQTRLRALVVDGDGGTARALLGAEGFTELALRRRFLRELAETDAKLTADVRRVEASAVTHREELREKLAELELTKKLIDEQRLLLTTTREERGRTLERVRGERVLLKRAADELVGKHRDLQALIGKLAEGPRYQPPTGKKGILKKGSLPWPVDGGMVIRKFGSVVDKDTRAEIMSNGIELRIDAGVPVIAVADGRIVHTGWLRGFGRIVIVDHGEGHHTLSAHLSRAVVGRGDEVKRGQTIGFVGDTESQNGPKLYFELRENGRPRDPAPFLRR